MKPPRILFPASREWLIRERMSYLMSVDEFVGFEWMNAKMELGVWVHITTL